MKKSKEETGKSTPRGRVIRIHDRDFEIIGENRLTARIFEAIAARSGIIMNALDEARVASFGNEKVEKPVYKHTILLGRDDEGHNLRAAIAVFPNSVVIQTLREVAVNESY
ncbi:MAG: hypothetical protein B6U86_05630 [Candidatus Altiarchaeales archaeon ex4484_43]|nr:MAG: hypothetical protein B6U86_05630 [Candidatus Altiarchaeales archaeon ex4484_43]